MPKKLTDAEIKKLEDKAPTTKTTMGEGKLGFTDYFGFEPPGFAEAGKKAVKPIPFSDEIEAFAHWRNRAAARDAARAEKLRRQVAESSSPEMRILTTLNYIGGKAKGEAMDAAIRHMENSKEAEAEDLEQRVANTFPKGRRYEGKVSDGTGTFKYKRGGSVKTASVRADGIAKRGKTRGRMV